MKKTFQLSVVIGVVLAKTEAAQGQTEDAQAQTEVDLCLRRARFGISILDTPSSGLTAPSSPR
jgi:hypothetical protein